MAKCIDRTDEQYRKIAGVLKQFMRKEDRDGHQTIPQALLSTATGAETQAAAVTGEMGDPPTS